MIENFKDNIFDKSSKDFNPKFDNNQELDKNQKEDLNPNFDDKSEGILQNNKIEGKRREEEVFKDLKEKYPEDKGYKIESETYLRDENGNIVKDKETGEARRVDFTVIKDNKVVDSVEVTSKTADKTEQSSKEARIRENGGNYIKDSDGNLVEIPDNVKTRIERRD